MRFEFKQGTVWATVEAGNARLVDRLLAIPDPSAQYALTSKIGLWDGLYHFYERDAKRFPAGLLPRLRRRLEKRGHEVVIDTRVDSAPQLPVPPSDCLEGIDLREHQMEGLELGLAARRGVFWHATNAGKGDVIVALSKVAMDAGLYGLVIVPNTAILMEIIKRFRERVGRRYKIGCFGDSRYEDGQTVVGTYQTLGRRDARCERVIARCGMVLVDEAHHAGSPAYHKILKACTNADYRFGFSGSVDKRTRQVNEAAVARTADTGRMHLWKSESFLGPVIHRVTNEYMIEKGYSAKPRIVMVADRAAFGTEVTPPPPKFDDDGNMIPVANLYGKVFDEAAIKDPTWLRTIARTIKVLNETGRPPFVFSHSVEHLKAIYAVCQKRGVEARLLHGGHSTAKRQATLNEFAKGGRFAVLSSPIFDEGVSVPQIRAIVLAGARRAVVELLQRVGRGVRRKEDDNTVVVVDYTPLHCAMLTNQAMERLAVYESEGFEITRVTDVNRLAEAL